MNIAVLGGTGSFGKAIAVSLGGRATDAAVIMNVNRRYKAHAGVRITGFYA